ncbi:hydroxymethylbilane synthase [Halorientalis pallida]|uniref:Hydroxymethylbilane synthase n=1 Tax=Halorientalis pallida TaxID=2479928 RepID=A0A498L5D6_9EURY|nr:hydroxymethylbilane synthase [Halorientalis pallida]RXK50487.1 hydroxymethylbilane synthase [Halorientalis pallida]
MTTDRTLRLATRGSDLALRQAATVEESLSSRRQSVELVEVETTGDQIQDELIHRLGKTGAFVRSLDQQVLDGEVDAAVHSMKDVPTESPPDLVVAGVPERGPAGDVLLTPDGTGLAELPEGATVGTASLRRAAELRAERPDLEIESLRGNVDTRVEKLLAPSLQREHERRLERAVGEQDDEDVDADDLDPENLSAAVLAEIEDWFDGLHEIERRATERDVDVEYDAIVLAEAGLDRMGLLHAVEFERLPTDTFVPAPGQGALAVTALDGEVGTEIHDRLDHPPTRVATSVERIVLDELGGGCVAPIGVHATVQGAVVHTVVRVLSRDGTEEVAASRDLPVEHHARAASDLAAELREQGAADLIARAKREEPDERKREDS